MKKKIAIVLLCLALLVGLRWGSTKISETMRSKGMADSMVPKVKITTIKEGDISTVIEAPGRVEAVYNVDIMARVSGFLQQQYFKDGSFVRKGETLMLIEPQEYQLAVNRAQAQLQSARAEAEKADKDFIRSKELVEKDYIPKSTYDAMLATRNVTRAQVANAQAALNDANRNLSYTRVTATASGRIGKIYITQGNYVTPQSGPLANIVSVDPIFVSFSIDSKQFNQLKNEAIADGQKQTASSRVEVIMPDNTVYDNPGIVDFYGNKISQSTGTMELRATFQNPDGTLIPGDFVRVKVYSNKTYKRIVVPQSSVLQDPAGKYVYKIDKNGNAERANIVTGDQHEDEWIVEQGLQPGDVVIAEGALKVMDKRPVKILSDEEYAKMLEDEQTRSGNGEQDKGKKGH